MNIVNYFEFMGIIEFFGVIIVVGINVWLYVFILVVIVWIVYS